MNFANIVSVAEIACIGALGVMALVATLFHIIQPLIDRKQKKPFEEQ
jgi:hypothetical protein